VESYCQYFASGYFGYSWPQTITTGLDQYPCPTSAESSSSPGTLFCTVQVGSSGVVFPAGAQADCASMGSGSFGFNWTEPPSLAPQPTPPPTPQPTPATFSVPPDTMDAGKHILGLTTRPGFNGSTIELPPRPTPYPWRTLVPIPYHTRVTLTGAAGRTAVIDANFTGGFLAAYNDAHLALVGLTFTRSASPGDQPVAAAIAINPGASLTATSCVFTGNDNFISVILAISAAAILLASCVFSHNGGRASVDLQSPCVSACGTSRIHNCTFEDNAAGSIPVAVLAGAQAEVSGSIFRRNLGGGVAVKLGSKGYPSTVSIVNSSFVGNSQSRYAWSSAVMAVGDYAVFSGLESCSFEANTLPFCLPASQCPPPPPPPASSSSHVAVFAAVAGFAVVAASGMVLGRRRGKSTACRRKGRCCRSCGRAGLLRDSGAGVQLKLLLGPAHIPETEIQKATEFFAAKNKLDEGAFGAVFRGTWGGVEVAVKVLKMDQLQRESTEEQNRPFSGMSGFKMELEVLSKYHHENIVTLLGHCLGGSRPSLVFEFVAGGSLARRLHGTEEGGTPLTAAERFSIASDTGRGLEFLHTVADPPIIHQDVKSANILLCSNGEGRLVAKVADFGAARAAPALLSATHHSTRNVVGTTPYMPVEYMGQGHVSERTDAFALGVVLLELLTGKPPANRSSNEFLYFEMIDVVADPGQHLAQHLAPDMEWPAEVRERAVALACVAQKCLEPMAQRRSTVHDVLPQLDAVAGRETVPRSGRGGGHPQAAKQSERAGQFELEPTSTGEPQQPGLSASFTSNPAYDDSSTLEPTSGTNLPTAD
jgi:serine/threonine protein kinase